MKVRSPFNFVLGIFCGLALILNIAKGADAFTLVICAFATVFNISGGLMGDDDE